MDPGDGKARFSMFESSLDSPRSNRSSDLFDYVIADDQIGDLHVGSYQELTLVLARDLANFLFSAS